MTNLMHAASSAALPVAIVLLVLGATARGVLWAQLDDPRRVKLANQYLAPLSTWSVVGFIVYALTLTAAGEAATAPLAIALVLAVAAAVLRVESEDVPVPRDAAPAMAAGGDAPPAHVASPAHLFDGPGEAPAAGGLWARDERR